MQLSQDYGFGYHYGQPQAPQFTQGQAVQAQGQGQAHIGHAHTAQAPIGMGPAQAAQMGQGHAGYAQGGGSHGGAGYGQGAGYGDSSASTAVNSRGEQLLPWPPAAPAAPAATETVRFEGEIQSFSSQKNWGFIHNPDFFAQGITEAADKGVFFHGKDNMSGRQLFKREMVSFRLECEASGKVQAKHIHPLHPDGVPRDSSGREVHQQQQGDKPRQQPPPLPPPAPPAALHAPVPARVQEIRSSPSSTAHVAAAALPNLPDGLMEVMMQTAMGSLVPEQQQQLLEQLKQPQQFQQQLQQELQQQLQQLLPPDLVQPLQQPRVQGRQRVSQPPALRPSQPSQPSQPSRPPQPASGRNKGVSAPPSEPMLDSGALRFEGVVETWNNVKGFGFLHSPMLAPLVPGPKSGVFCHIKDFENLPAGVEMKPGMRVTFSFSMEANGKPRAKSVLFADKDPATVELWGPSGQSNPDVQGMMASMQALLDTAKKLGDMQQQLSSPQVEEVQLEQRQRPARQTAQQRAPLQQPPETGRKEVLRPLQARGGMLKPRAKPQPRTQQRAQAAVKQEEVSEGADGTVYGQAEADGGWSDDGPPPEAYDPESMPEVGFISGVAPEEPAPEGWKPSAGESDVEDTPPAQQPYEDGDQAALAQEGYRDCSSELLLLQRRAASQAAPAAEEATPESAAERMLGIVMTYNAGKAYGFLQSPQLFSAMGEESGVFFHLKDFVVLDNVSAPTPGLPVTFVLGQDPRPGGKPRALQVRPAEQLEGGLGLGVKRGAGATADPQALKGEAKRVRVS
eukprot:TRINITY_DN44462_c0_g1_i1.p1 TRINITY_DN44462_c0_g1~~TRINITY_DN44462_c0_g1_i1.p1  ORF type:complete len:792 (+),score=208.78 TRINITY_DN44462_c0_g1_i1:82-2457(+)